MADGFSILANKIRDVLGISLDIWLNPIDTLNRAQIAGYVSGYRFVPDTSLPFDIAKWDSQTRLIDIRVSLKEPIENGDVQARFTVFHELSHAFLGHRTRNRKPDGALQFGRFAEQDERDADDLAADFSAPLHLALSLNVKTTDDIVRHFGIPASIAVTHLVALEKLRRRQATIPDEEDSYAAAMHEMAINARDWNSEF